MSYILGEDKKLSDELRKLEEEISLLEQSVFGNDLASVDSMIDGLCSSVSKVG